jgi:branched-chain amino acid transport system substrate-binding protein
MLVAAACSGDDSGDTTTTTSETSETTATTEAPKAPITVAAINQQDGVVAWPEMVSAANAILDWYNAQGGIDGHPIELNLCTAGDEPESTQACAQQFANDDAVEYVFSMAVPNSATMFEAVGAAGKPMVGHLLWDIPDSVQPDLYSSDPGVLAIATVLLEHLVDDLGYSSVGIVTTDSPFGRDTADFISFLVEGYGATTEAVFYDEGTADYLPAFASVDLEGLDAILFLPFTLAECVPAAEALTTLGWENTTISTDLCAGQSFAESGAFDGWLYAMPSAALVEGNPDRDLLVSIFDEYGDGVQVDGFAVNAALETFWLIEVLEDAYALAGSEAITGDNIRAAAEAWSGHLTTGPDTLDCPGVGGFVANCNSAALVMKLQDGIFVDQTGFRLIDMNVYAPLLEG